MLLLECPTCGTQIVTMLEENALKTEKHIVQCAKCKHYAEITAGLKGVSIVAVDEISMVIKGMREIADQIENGKITLVRSRHGKVKVGGRGKIAPHETDMFAIEVMYR